MMYDKQVCTIYRADNGFVIECPEPPAKPSKKGNMPVAPASPEVYLAANAKDALKIVEKELNGDETPSQEFSRGFDEAAKSK